jgi:phage virion morphogenesis protein
VAIGSNAVYAAIHQFGGPIRQPKRKRIISIPARPFLGLDQDDEREIIKIAEDWLVGEGGR